jgi:hypothetical protein
MEIINKFYNKNHFLFIIIKICVKNPKKNGHKNKNKNILFELL